jgi:hypothetical protein
MCKSSEGKWKTPHAAARFQSILRFLAFLGGGANFSQALTFSSPLLLLKKESRKRRDKENCAGEGCGNVEILKKPNPPG